ncbi:2-hydroxy-3-oxopropionate reductase (EC [Olavius algarvensis Delta 1 endosymbiont]|nr:2-hydroxy-3-oxopropionate reductase (EC [Olavius algarvensis Delta 1 endosymbiont]
MQIGFIGLGIMGSRMAANLQKAGHEIMVYNRSREKADTLIKNGARWCDTPAQLAVKVDILFTMLAHPEAVSQAALGPEGYLANLKRDAIWIDCSTVNPSFARAMAAEARKRHVRYVDAPVMGTKKPAGAGQLVFFVGGAKADVDTLKPYFEIMGKAVNHVGEQGMGAAYKMVANLLVAQNILIFSEAVALGRALGFTQEMLFETLLDGPLAAPYLSLKRSKIEGGHYEADFPLKWMHKDLHLVALTAYENGVALPAANAAKEVFLQAKRSGLGEKDFAAIFDYLSSRETF